MIQTHSSEARASARRAVVEGLARLRTQFPLEARLRATPPTIRTTYSQILVHWLTGSTPPLALFDATALDILKTLDAIVPGPEGVGCYPFSARSTGINVTLAGGTVPAMCAVDALAVARLATQSVTIHSHCAECEAHLQCRVEDDGSLDHDQTDRAHVIWRHAKPVSETDFLLGCQDNDDCNRKSASDRGFAMLFICPACANGPDTERYTLPQAAAIGNAFFAFQRALLSRNA
jgi:hypothetical protein